MRILLANSTCKVGGVSTFLLSLRSALRKLGHETGLFFFERGPMEAHLPADCEPRFGSLADLLQTVERERFDVVHANNVDWPTGIAAARELGARLVLTAHKVREPAWTYGWHAGNCDAFVAVSRWIRDGLQPFTDVPIQVVHNGIDTDRFRPAGGAPDGPPIVAWVGRGSAPRKRLETFAAVAPRLRDAGLRVWVIDSQDPHLFAEAWPDAARTLHAAAERWHAVPVDEMASVYQRIAASGGCIVSTASMEGLPLTLLEAQACGCLVIAARVRGVDECVAAEHGGVLYPSEAGDAEIARLIVQTLADAPGAHRRGRAAAGHVASAFSLRRMAEQYVSIYESCPLPALAPLRRQRRRHSPLLHWRSYVDERLGVGYVQHAAARELARRGDAAGAAAAARASMRTAATMYAHPARLWRLARLLSRRAPPRSSARAAAEPTVELAPDEKRRTRLGNRVA
jgi:glycosyltransferase involved in cell wall biosynthesis